MDCGAPRGWVCRSVPSAGAGIEYTRLSFPGFELSPSLTLPATLSRKPVDVRLHA